MSGSAILDYEQAMALVIDRVDDDAASAEISGTFTPRVTVIRRPSANAPWAPSPPRPSGPQPRAAALPHLDEPSTASAQETIALPAELEASFRTLCALRAVDPTRVLQGLVRSYVILGLAQGVK